MRAGQRAKTRMVQANLRLVVTVAKKYACYGVDLLDLIQEGNVGLLEAVKQFDPYRGVRFPRDAWHSKRHLLRVLKCMCRVDSQPIQERVVAGVCVHAVAREVVDVEACKHRR